MEFSLSEEQQELAATVRTLLAKRADSSAVRTAMASETGFDAGLWQTLCEQIEVAALGIPEERGGAGFTLLESLVALEEVGRSLAPTPLLSSLVASQALLAGADDDAQDRLLPRIAAGQVATLAWSGTRGPGLDEPVTAEGGRLTGTVQTVLDGDQAEVLLVAARTGPGVALFEVDTASVDRAWTPSMDQGARLASLRLDATPGVLVAADATPALQRAALVAAAGSAALAVGAASRGLEMTVAYAKEREQFGRPIGSFQALKHRMADMLVRVEMARSASWAASYAVSSGAANAAELAAVAKSYCCEALSHVAAETVQLHGGIAITWEHDAQLVFKRAHALAQLFGAPHRHRGLVTL
ncbi:acyl-CoA dehydrogenase family protein [Nocardioides ferulae]|uniref:acyl-CoA dehydrogenase family protein n=1 Tax=Nocardioides ferulae TaxID=2340821 RepID=UPI000EABAD87|nr:acyl-CoA dehydrogenase family protein [Nocardioides ferulae]